MGDQVSPSSAAAAGRRPGWVYAGVFSVAEIALIDQHLLAAGFEAEVAASSLHYLILARTGDEVYLSTPAKSVGTYPTVEQLCAWLHAESERRRPQSDEERQQYDARSSA